MSDQKKITRIQFFFTSLTFCSRVTTVSLVLFFFKGSIFACEKKAAEGNLFSSLTDPHMEGHSAARYDTTLGFETPTLSAPQGPLSIPSTKAKLNTSPEQYHPT